MVCVRANVCERVSLAFYGRTLFAFGGGEDSPTVSSQGRNLFSIYFLGATTPRRQKQRLKLAHFKTQRAPLRRDALPTSNKQAGEHSNPYTNMGIFSLSPRRSFARRRVGFGAGAASVGALLFLCGVFVRSQCHRRVRRQVPEADGPAGDSQPLHSWQQPRQPLQQPGQAREPAQAARRLPRRGRASSSSRSSRRRRRNSQKRREREKSGHRRPPRCDDASEEDEEDPLLREGRRSRERQPRDGGDFVRGVRDAAAHHRDAPRPDAAARRRQRPPRRARCARRPQRRPHLLRAHRRRVLPLHAVVGLCWIQGLVVFRV
jgi:hypothetical protein